MHIRYLFFTVIFCFVVLTLKGQTVPVHPSVVTTGTFWGVTKPLRDLPVMTAKDFREMEKRAKKHPWNEGLEHRAYPYAATALPKGADPVLQNYMGQTKSMNGPIVNFEAQTSPYFPPDCNGTPGINHFFQTVNCTYAIYDKTGALVAGPTAINLIFGNVPGSNRNDGDPIVLYDQVADRWLVTEFSIPNSGQNYMMVAVSTTSDPTGTYYQYSFPVATMPDYPKFGIWRDGYYMGDNNSGGNDIYVFERSQMLTGGTAQEVSFNNPYRPASVDGFMCVPPVDNDGPFAAAGTPEYYIAFNDDALGGGSDQLWLYELSVNWTTPSSSTFNRTQQLDVEPFNANFGPNWNNISQPGTSQKVDGIPQVIMNVPQYRNFGSYQTIVACHTVNVDGAGHAGVRWYELRNTSGTWSVRQQGTYAPDVHNRWMGSIMLNAHNKIALGYSVSSTTVYPSIRYCGQSPAEYNNASGVLDIAEDTIQVGAYSQTGINRWGDYSLMSVDPTDDETFWFTDEFIGAGGSRKTKVASFKFNTGPLVTTIAATDITGISAMLNGTVNPNGATTAYYFKYGVSPLSLSDSTAVDSIPAGTTPVNISTLVLNLAPHTKYYFKAVGVNVAGTALGSALFFTTGDAPTLAVTPPNQNVDTTAGSTTFLVASNYGWTVTSDASWCTVTPSGTGNDTIFATYSEHPVIGTRIANITVTVIGLPPQIVTVTQAGIPVILAVTPPHRNVTVQAGTTKFYVTSNTNWTVSSNSPWCTVTPAGSLSDSITVTYAANTAVGQRIDTVTVMAAGVGGERVTVIQEGIPALLAVDPPNQNVAALLGNTTFTVTSNTDWTAISDATWCTITPSGSGNGTIVADFTENTAHLSRVANIQVTVPTLPAQTVTVTQGKSTIGIGEQSLNAVKIYPNPTRGVFKIVPAQGNNALDVTVQDLNGKVILQKECRGESEYEISLADAPQGTYDIIIKSGSEKLVRKLVIIK